MRPETVEKLYELIYEGATVVGEAPSGLATLSGGKDAQKRFDRTIKKIWGKYVGNRYPADRKRPYHFRYNFG